LKTIFKKTYRLLLLLIPENRLGDHFVAFINFVRAHRRLPSHKILFNDVLYRIKTSDEIIDPLRVFVSDKEFVKLFVKTVVGDQHNVPTIKILSSIEDVMNYQFPSDCCIKPTHLSGEVILRKMNRPVDFEKINGWFKKSYYHINRELNYKTLKPKVIVEPLIFGSDNLSDFKIFCYMGKPKLIQVDIDRYIDHTEKFYDLDWNELPFSIHFPRSTSHPIEKPKNLGTMLAIATSLSSHFNFVRIDLYSNGDECLVGEITNCPGGATGFVANLYSSSKENQAKETISTLAQASGPVTPEAAEILASKMIFGDDCVSEGY
jgi:hypothetical protein